MRLSKSRLVAYLQCPKRLWLQVNRRELAQPGEALANRIAQGNLVGAAARRLYPDGVLIEHVHDLDAAVAATHDALAAPGDVTLFEPALRAGDVLVRADVLVREAGRYRMIEVKSSTKVKPYHVTDAAIQAWVARAAGVPIAQAELAHIDNRFVYPGGGAYRGLFAHVDVTGDIAPLEPDVPAWIAGAQGVLAGPMPAIAVGRQCREPFECDFHGYCAPATGPYPVELLPNSTKLARRLREDGFADVRDVPPDRLPRADQQRIWRATTSGVAELDPAAAGELVALAWPRYYFDVETVGPAVPLWPGTRPYQKIAMQWSCHREDADGTVTELPPFLDTAGADPRRAFAESAVSALGEAGAILVYNATFERGVLLELADAFADLAPALRACATRLFDLLPVARAHYYHPAMLGSWSIKRVLPTIAPDLDYGNLDAVQSGDMVEPVYFEMIDLATPPARREALATALLTYCARDTLAMVRIARFFAAAGTPAAADASPGG